MSKHIENMLLRCEKAKKKKKKKVFQILKTFFCSSAFPLVCVPPFSKFWIRPLSRLRLSMVFCEIYVTNAS